MAATSGQQPRSWRPTTRGWSSSRLPAHRSAHTTMQVGRCSASRCVANDDSGAAVSVFRLEQPGDGGLFSAIGSVRLRSNRNRERECRNCPPRWGKGREGAWREGLSLLFSSRVERAADYTVSPVSGVRVASSGILHAVCFQKPTT